MFSSEFWEIFKKTFFTEHLWTTASVNVWQNPEYASVTLAQNKAILYNIYSELLEHITKISAYMF